MDKVRLYKATVTKEVFFVAKEDISPASLAKIGASAFEDDIDTCGMGDIIPKISTVHTLYDVPEMWRDALPWGPFVQVDGREKTIQELLEGKEGSQYGENTVFVK